MRTYSGKHAHVVRHNHAQRHTTLVGICIRNVTRRVIILPEDDSCHVWLRKLIECSMMMIAMCDH